jgi:hypothetical protein
MNWTRIRANGDLFGDGRHQQQGKPSRKKALATWKAEKIADGTWRRPCQKSADTAPRITKRTAGLDEPLYSGEAPPWDIVLEFGEVLWE